MIRALAFVAALIGAATAAAAAPARCTLSTRQVIDRFVPLFYGRKDVRSAFERWVDPGYIQHNPFAATGRQAAIDFLEPFFEANPQARYTVHRVIVDGDTAVVHNEADFGAAMPRNAVVDIFRVKDCRIVEHWDVIQPIPAKSANANGMF